MSLVAEDLNEAGSQTCTYLYLVSLPMNCTIHLNVITGGQGKRNVSEGNIPSSPLSI